MRRRQNRKGISTSALDRIIESISNNSSTQVKTELTWFQVPTPELICIYLLVLRWTERFLEESPYYKNNFNLHAKWFC
jgi:hypothetical protein